MYLATLPLFVLTLAAAMGRRARVVSALGGVVLYLVFDALTPRGKLIRFDLMQPYDPWVLGALAAAVAWPLLARLVMTEIGATSPAGAGLARFTLAFLAIYAGGRALLHERAVLTIESRIYENGTPKSYRALPSAGNPLAWTGLIEFEGSWKVVAIDLRYEYDPASGKAYYQAKPPLN